MRRVQLSIRPLITIIIEDVSTITRLSIGQSEKFEIRPRQPDKDAAIVYGAK